MSRAKCSKTTRNPKIPVEENKRKVTFLNEAREPYTVTQVDGCMVRGAVASDYVVSQVDLGDAVIELKGTDVDHAVKQIEATAKMWTDQKYRCGRMAAIVVCAQYPRIDTKIQRMKSRMAKQYGAPLHVLSRNVELRLARALEFDGPL